MEDKMNSADDKIRQPEVSDVKVRQTEIPGKRAAGKESKNEKSRQAGISGKRAAKNGTKKETKKERNARVGRILELLDGEYGLELRCALIHETGWQLLFSTILSAQCTDKRVNIVTETLYRKYPSIEAFANADFDELKEDIRSIGFYQAKARNLIKCANQLMYEFGGEVPSEIEELTKLAGVGRKTANVIRGNIYNIPSIVVDTHVKRISRLLGLTDTDDPEKAEYELMEILPEDHWILWNIDIITLGRNICVAGRPRCSECFLKEECPHYNERIQKL